jgi:hypothetical protein
MMLRLMVVIVVVATSLLAVKGDDPPKQSQASGLALSNQGLQQKQTQAETQRLASRLDGMLRVLAYHQLDATAEQKIMDEAAGSLKGLSREQMKDILARLDQAVKTPSPIETDQHLDAAHEKHREVLDRLRLLITRFESMRSLEQAAQQIDKIAKEQVNLRERVQRADQQRREAPQGRPSRRGMRPESPSSQAMRQQDLARDTEAVLQKIDELKTDVPEELKPRIDRTLEIAQERQLLETMRDAANHIRYRNAREADDRQIQATSDLERLARTLRAPTEKLAALQEARDRVQKLIPKQQALRDESEAAKDPRQADSREARPNTREANANKQAAQQTELQVQTRDTQDLIKEHATDVAGELKKADKAMAEAKDRLRTAQPQKAVEPQDKAVKNLETAKERLDQLVAEEEKRQRDPLVGLQKAIEDLEKLIAEQQKAQHQAKNAIQQQKPQDLKPQAPKQQNLAYKAEEVARRPMAARPEAKDLIQQASEAMHAASEQLHTQQGEPAVQNQERAIKDLTKARDALKEDAKTIEQRREQIAQMQKAGEKLDELQKQEKSIAQKAQKQSEAKDSPETKQSNERLSNEQMKTKGQTDQLTQELKDLAPKAADKTKASSPTMQQAADALDQQQAKQGAEKAEQAAKQLGEAKDALDEALAQKQAEEAAAEAMQNPDKVQPGEAAAHVAKALMETKEAAKQAAQAAQKGEQSKQSMEKSQQATQSAQSAVDQAKALSPQNVMPPLDNARKDLEKAQKDLNQSSPQDAKSSQDQAAQQLNQALKSLQQTMQAMEKMQGNQPQTAQNDQQGNQQQGQKGQQQTKGQQQKSQQKSETAQNSDDKQKNGDPSQNGERDGNAKAEKLDVRGSSTFVNLPARQRELILQALSEKLPPEHAAQIQRYFESIAGGKSATEKKK